MKAVPGPYTCELKVLTRDGVTDDGQYINPYTVKDYYAITAGQGFWDSKDNTKGFQLTGYMSEGSAKLMAAAPDLLEALEVAEFRLECILDEGPDDAIALELKSIKSAINKAKGL